MEPLVTTMVTRMPSLVAVLVSSSRSQAVIEIKLDELSRRAEKHNQAIKRQHTVECRVSLIGTGHGRVLQQERVAAEPRTHDSAGGYRRPHSAPARPFAFRPERPPRRSTRQPRAPLLFWPIVAPQPAILAALVSSAHGRAGRLRATAGPRAHRRRHSAALSGRRRQRACRRSSTPCPRP